MAPVTVIHGFKSIQIHSQADKRAFSLVRISPDQEPARMEFAVRMMSPFLLRAEMRSAPA
jgi:hypothetical protein